VSLQTLRERVAWALRYMEEKGLNYGYSGNVSARAGPGAYLITPGGVRKAEVKPEDLLLVDGEGRVIEGTGKPSVELPLHLAIYKARPDVGAIIHAHPIYATVLSVLRLDLEPIVEELALYVGGGVRVADYAPSGTEKLAENALKALGDRNAAILANHGVLACGSDVDEALKVLESVERAAQIYLLARLAGEPTKLPKEVVEHEVALFRRKREQR
jgi:L-fuculose-phosphate aldolase